MILDFQRFLQEERPFWSELETVLEGIQQDPYRRMTLAEVERFHYLYERAAADLARLTAVSGEASIRNYLEMTIARAFAEIHESRAARSRIQAGKWFFHIFPQTFRKHIRAFSLVVGLMLGGAVFGGFAIALDPGAKPALMPFSHLQGDPRERVAQEEKNGAEDHLRGAKSQFSAYLMTHNTRVAIFTLALGVTYGIGTVIITFYNGVIIGAVALDYLLAGQGAFLLGWLLPHGTVEIPAICIAGQGGFVLAQALIGRGRRRTMRDRLRQIAPDLATLIGAVALLLVWAGIVEAFFSQYHEPILPYWLKTTFGTVQLTALILFLTFSGRGQEPQTDKVDNHQ